MPLFGKSKYEGYQALSSPSIEERLTALEKAPVSGEKSNSNQEFTSTSTEKKSTPTETYKPQFEKIIPISTPQWDWTNDECRWWLRRFCVANLGLALPAAKAIAERFEGFGPNVYLMKIGEWKELLGETSGKGIYWWLLNCRFEAVPEVLHIAHGWKDTREKDQID